MNLGKAMLSSYEIVHASIITRKVYLILEIALELLRGNDRGRILAHATNPKQSVSFNDYSFPCGVSAILLARTRRRSLHMLTNTVIYTAVSMQF